MVGADRPKKKKKDFWKGLGRVEEEEKEGGGGGEPSDEIASRQVYTQIYN